MDEPPSNEQINEWIRIQKELGSQVQKHDDPRFILNNVRFVGGFDVSYRNGLAAASLVVCSYPYMQMVYNNTSTPVEVSVPYRSGFLAFHEIEFFMEQYKKLRTERPDLIPQITMIDGNGIYHERRCGAASHYGLKANIPTIGVAKKFKCLPEDGIEKDEYRKRFRQMDTRGSIDIVTKNKEVLGKAALNTDIVRNPIFISIGHRCSLQTCMEVVLKCSRYRIPEPIRIADKLSREKVKSSPVV